MTPDVSNDLLVSTLDETTSAADCSNDAGATDLPAHAAGDAQSQICGAWVAMLRWYEAPQSLTH